MQALLGTIKKAKGSLSFLDMFKQGTTKSEDGEKST